MVIYVCKMSEIRLDILAAMHQDLKVKSGHWFVLLNGRVHDRFETEEEANLEADGISRWFS